MKNDINAAESILNKFIKYILYSRFIRFNKIIPRREAFIKVTSEVDKVIAAIPSFSINNEFNINFIIMDDKAIKNGVLESLNE